MDPGWAAIFIFLIVEVQYWCTFRLSLSVFLIIVCWNERVSACSWDCWWCRCPQTRFAERWSNHYLIFGTQTRESDMYRTFWCLSTSCISCKRIASCITPRCLSRWIDSWNVIIRLLCSGNKGTSTSRDFQFSYFSCFGDCWIFNANYLKPGRRSRSPSPNESYLCPRRMTCDFVTRFDGIVAL